MPSATDFLPSSMTEFMNFERTRSPNFGSGRISRFSGRRRRDIVIPFSSAFSGTSGRTLSGAYSCGLFGALGAVFGTRLLAVLHALRVEDAAKHVVADARKVAHTAAADQHDAVLLEVVALAGDVADHLALVGQADLRHLAKRRVRLLRGRCVDTGADAALLRVLLHCRDLRLGLLRFATLADQLVNRWHEAASPFSGPTKVATFVGSHRCRKSRRLLCSTEKARSRSSIPRLRWGRLATRMLSNVQLFARQQAENPSRADGRRHSDEAVKGQ